MFVATAFFAVTSVKTLFVANSEQVAAVFTADNNGGQQTIEELPTNIYSGENEDSYNQKVEQEIFRLMQEEDKKKVAEAKIAEENNEAVTTQKYSDSDFRLLSLITFAEAGNQTLEQQIAVAATVLNRVESEIFPDSIQEVISQRGQFSSVKNGNVYAFGKVLSFDAVPESCKEAARRALAGEDPTEQLLRQEATRRGLDPEEYANGGALYFFNPECTAKSELEKRYAIKVQVQFGDHIFYKVWS